MQLRHITAMVAVADSGSLRAAAIRLGVSQPALTKAIRELETLMGVSLLQKTVRGTIPTDAGRVFLVRARSIVEEMQRAKQEMSHLAGVKAGSATVGLSVGAALLSGGAIQTFMRTHPNVQVRVIEGLFHQLVSGVRQGRLDFSVGGLPAAEIEERLHCDILFQNRIVPAVRHDHPLANARSFSDLVDCEWALTTDDPTYIAHLNAHFSSLGLPAPRIRLRCESFFTLLQLAPHMDFIVAISHTLLRHPVTAKHLRPIEISDPCPTARFALLRKADVPLTPHAKALAHYITAAAAELQHLDASTATGGEPSADFQRTFDKVIRRRSHALASSESHVQLRE